MENDLKTLRETPRPPIPFPDMPRGGVLIGLGADIIDIARVRAVHLRQGERFLERVFTKEELAYCMGMGEPHQHLAARFAAKEAVSKAFGTGIGAEIGWHSVSIYHGTRQEPLVRLDEKARALLKTIGATHALITLSHTETAAMAVAALVHA